MASVGLFGAFRRFVSRTVKIRKIHERVWTHRVRTAVRSKPTSEPSVCVCVTVMWVRGRVVSLMAVLVFGVCQAGAASLLLVSPSYLLYDRVSRLPAVSALEKAEEVLEQADYLYSCGETQKLHQLLVQYKDSNDAEFLWRLARAARDLSLLSSVSADEKKRLAYEAFDFAKKALEINESSFAAHKWFAVCLSDIGNYEGVKVKIGNSFIIKDHLERAIELNPKDATSIHILGYWCFAFAELPWYQRKVAAVIFASPPTATYEEALAYFLKAEEVDPNFYSMNLLMLGKTYMMLSDTEHAVLWLHKARDYPAVTEEDRQVHKEALDLLKKLKA